MSKLAAELHLVLDALGPVSARRARQILRDDPDVPPGLRLLLLSEVSRELHAMVRAGTARVRFRKGEGWFSLRPHVARAGMPE